MESDLEAKKKSLHLLAPKAKKKAQKKSLHLLAPKRRPKASKASLHLLAPPRKRRGGGGAARLEREAARLAALQQKIARSPKLAHNDEVQVRPRPPPACATHFS